MASKKLLLLTGMFCLLASYGYSQRVGASYDVKDSSVVPDKRMPQHTEFLNGTYNFPAEFGRKEDKHGPELFSLPFYHIPHDPVEHGRLAANGLFKPNFKGCQFCFNQVGW